MIACSEEDATSSTTGTIAAPPFGDVHGQAPPANPAYPDGPYGTRVGDVVRDFPLEGFPSPATSTADLAPIRFSDFYNPHGRDAGYAPLQGEPDDRYFPASSPYGHPGELKPLALVLETGSVWCPPCNLEADSILPPLHDSYRPCGGEFLLSLEDGLTQQVPAQREDLEGWTKQYEVDYPAVIDPARLFETLMKIDAIPSNVIVDTTTMKIVVVNPGVPAGQCGDGNGCLSDADCQLCHGLCSDLPVGCITSNDCMFPATCDNIQCGDGTPCASDADCTGKTCSQSEFWKTYESLLDKNRPGCSLP